MELGLVRQLGRKLRGSGLAPQRPLAEQVEAGEADLEQLRQAHDEVADHRRQVGAGAQCELHLRDLALEMSALRVDEAVHPAERPAPERLEQQHDREREEEREVRRPRHLAALGHGVEGRERQPVEGREHEGEEGVEEALAQDDPHVQKLIANDRDRESQRHERQRGQHEEAVRVGVERGREGHRDGEERGEAEDRAEQDEEPAPPQPRVG
ncbi:MAG: hypothetical protein M5U13_07715 [Thermoanaerobaculia bacterium]|nr:hypothetical protein [Thermoanaerobaculia bacterium]